MFWVVKMQQVLVSGFHSGSVDSLRFHSILDLFVKDLCLLVVTYRLISIDPRIMMLETPIQQPLWRRAKPLTVNSHAQTFTKIYEVLAADGAPSLNTFHVDSTLGSTTSSDG